ncbi:hypothetical protein ACVWXQ_006333 [Bradyrhizobium sp. S3.14.4]
MLAPAPGQPHVAGGEQQQAAGADIGGAGGELGLPHRPDQGGRLLFGEQFGDVLDLRLRQAGHALDLLGRPLRNLLPDLIQAIDALSEEFLVLPAILENVPQHAVDRGDMRAGANPDIFGRVRSGPRHPGIDHDHVGAVELLAFKNVLQRNRMGLGRIATHQQDGLGVADVVVAVGHRAVAPGIGYTGDRRGVADPRLMIGIIGAPKRRKLAIEISGLVGELGGAKPIDRVGPRLLADIQQLVADLVDRRLPGDARPLSVDELYGVTQASFVQHVVANCRTLAAMRAAINRTVVVGLLPDPYAVGDLGDHRATDRAVRADVLAGRDRCADGWRRTGFGLAHAVQRDLTHRGQRASRDSRALQERPPVQFRRCFVGRRIEKPGTLRTTFGLPDQHGSLLSSGIAVDAVEIPDFPGVRSIASLPLLIEINGLCGSRCRQQLAGTQRTGTDNRQPKQVTSKKLWRLIILQRSTLPVGVRPSRRLSEFCAGHQSQTCVA